jgi:hypothetical protein
MNKQEKAELETELKGIAGRIFNAYNNGATLEVIIHKTSKSNMTWYYTVKLWYLDSNGVVSAMWLNYFISQMEGTKLKDDYVKGYGCGTERSFQVAYNLGHYLAKLGFSQDNSKDAGYLINRYSRTC